MRSMNDNTTSKDAVTEGDAIPTNVITIISTPKVVRNATFESTTSAEETDGEFQFASNRNETSYFPDKISCGVDHEYYDDDDDDDGVDSNRGNDFRRASSTRDETLGCGLFSSWEEIATHVLYISTFAVIGTVLRSYIGRFFGLDCIRDEQDDDSHTDFLTSLSKHICITSDGKTQRGGAIFIDLPANMLGS